MDGSEPAERTVLLVDDDDAIRETVRDVLGDEGIRVVTARNGEEALALLRTTPAPGLILLDLSMPVLDGEGFRREQLASPELAHIPVVAFSAVTQLADRVRLLDLDDYLTKPLHLDQLVAAVRRFLH